MKQWHCYKYTSDGWVTKKWQIYYKEDDGRRRYFGESFDYPTASALVEALSDSEIRDYAVEHYNTDIKHVYEHTKAHMDIFNRIKTISHAHGCEIISSNLLAQIIECE